MDKRIWISNYFYILFVFFMFLIINSPLILAQENESQIVDQNLTERIELIEASQQFSKAKTNISQTAAVSLYACNYHTNNTQYKLGAKFEKIFYGNMNSTNLSYVIEGIYLDNEEEDVAAFLSLQTTLSNRMFSPYFGLGAEVMNVADYQIFLGLNLSQYFFVETKFINEKDDLEEGDFYSAFGFKIPF